MAEKQQQSSVKTGEPWSRTTSLLNARVSYRFLLGTKSEKGYLQWEHTVQCPVPHKNSAFLLPLNAATVSTDLIDGVPSKYTAALHHMVSES